MCFSHHANGVGYTRCVTPDRVAAAQALIAPAIDRAIRDIIQRVVEHSVTIACTTARDLVSKDYITEPGV